MSSSDAPQLTPFTALLFIRELPISTRLVVDMTNLAWRYQFTTVRLWASSWAVDWE